ncbi:hypothetical protein [Moraxella ovis]|nr:hypothetical protein [Moraxella ovis]
MKDTIFIIFCNKVLTMPIKSVMLIASHRIASHRIASHRIAS